MMVEGKKLSFMLTLSFLLMNLLACLFCCLSVLRELLCRTGLMYDFDSI